MSKVSSKIALMMTLVLVLQMLLPIAEAFASEEPLSAPTNLSATQSFPGDVRLTWNTVSGAQNYNVYQLVDGEKELVGNTSLSRLIIRDLSEGTYIFALTSVSTSQESALSESLLVEVEYPVMQAPVGLNERIVNGNDIQLRWNEAEFVTEYRIYQVNDEQRELVAITDRTNQWFRNMPEGEYVFEVTSYSDRFGESVEASRLEIDLVYPEMQAPEGLNERITNGNDIQLRWNEAEYVTEYRIYQVNDEQRELVATTDRTNQWFRNMPEGEYVYEVTSYSERFGESTEASRLEINLIHPKMQAPEGLNERLANGNDIQLRWNEAEYVTEYRIYQIEDSQRELVAKTDRTNQWFRDMPEGDYVFEVTSYSDRFGESAEASRLEINLVHSSMESPQNLHERITNGNDIQLRWNEVDYATEYRIYQWIEGELKLVDTTDRTNRWFRDMPEGEYVYEVTSYSDRFGESRPSILEVNLEHPVMEAPGGLNERITNGNDIQLRWNEAEYATEYKIYQWIDGERQLVETTDRTNQWFRNMPEGEYSFEVTSYSDRFGESKASSLTINHIHPIMEPPTGLNERFANGNDVQLRWNEVAYATKYKIYQWIDGDRKLVAETDRTNQWFRDLDEGYYSFEINSYSDRFGESVNASELNVTVNFPEMEAPVIRIGAENESDIRINWNAIEYVEKYNIYELVGAEAILLGSTDRTNFWVRDITDGVHDYVVTAVNERFGESVFSNTVTIEIISDITPPETISNIVEKWVNHDFTVELTATDTESGVAATYYSVNGSDFTEGTNVTITEEGVNEVSYYSVDNAGNVEEVKTEKVKIDKTAPETTSNIVNEWVKDDFTVELTATDSKSGVSATYYSVNGSDFTEGTNFTITEEGVTQVSYYSVDNAGNVEEIKTEYVKIDKTAPETSSNIEEKWFKDDFTVKLTVTGAKSGVAATYYSVNGSDFTEGTNFTITEEGVTQVSYYSVDNAGNVEEIKTEYVKIDKTAPETISNIEGDWLKNNFTVELAVTDTKSGVAVTYFSVNGSEFKEGTNFTITEEGVNEVSYYSVDKAGNVEEVKTEYVKVDKTAPIVSWNYSDEYVLGTELPLVYEAYDSISGIKYETLFLNGEEINNGDVVTLENPGEYTLKVSVEDHAGWITTLEHKFVVYLPATIEVTPGIIQGNNGVFTVRVTILEAFDMSKIKLETANLNGTAAIAGSNGNANQAKQGQFKFNREDFVWGENEKHLEFRGYVGEHLIVGSTTVKVINNNNQSNGKSLQSNNGNSRTK
ncbi:hypothetical protein J2S74_001914 [Evansella vedderi]|uniref:Fibronectin type-III domain-containing protein n=1 Tax=Evansella vedderi TaxID=38282 RepID=A0ABT9ZTH4_9BACI|nr:hypothetical protein [Evansella vedderi]MDQ0254535.1 hypothetical protein [Evansella vedderi]